ncbi:MAG: prepilin-type N-terminal cleavage/methylation domain-containing protein [Gammaproteobacteria bacterium]
MKRQTGFTLIELMIGVLIGLIAVAATLTVVAGIIRSNTDYMRMVRLNQELNAVMNLMVRDLKRVGYSATADGKTANNLFMQGTDDLTFSDPVATDLYRQIEFTYDRDGDGVVDDNERLGFAFDTVNNAVEAKLSPGSWLNISDDEAIQITDLTFSDELLSITSIAPDMIRYVAVSLTGNLTDDPDVSRTITERVRIRNDRP